MTFLKINYFTDPGHGWASVKLSILEDLGLIDQISHYSYIDGKSAYLEEDCDMGRLFDACKARNIELQLTEKHTNNRSKIRGFSVYTPIKARAALYRAQNFVFVGA